MKRVHALARLVRISALPSALADVVGGIALAYFLAGEVGIDLAGWSYLLMAAVTTGIYLGGMASNDLLHVKKDRALGKNRPIVAGDISFGAAAAVTLFLYGGGLLAAWRLGVFGYVLLLAGLTLIYNLLSAGAARYLRVPSVAVIALCRAVNVSIPSAVVFGPWALSETLVSEPVAAVCLAVVFVYFAAVTSISLFEDRGGGATAVRVSGLLAALAVFALPVYVLATMGIGAYTISGRALPAVVIALMVWSWWAAVSRAAQEPTPRNIGAAVGAGIRGECLLMALFAFLLMPQWPFMGFIALALYPAGKFMARWVSPT